MYLVPNYGFPVGSVVKNPPANAGDTRDAGSIPGSGRSPGEGHGNPLQCSWPGESPGQSSLVGNSPWGRKVSDTTEHTYKGDRTKHQQSHQKTSEQTPRSPREGTALRIASEHLWLVSFFHKALCFIVEAIFASCSEFETSGKYKEQNQITSLRILNVVVGQR